MIICILLSVLGVVFNVKTTIPGLKSIEIHMYTQQGAASPAILSRAVSFIYNAGGPLTLVLVGVEVAGRSAHLPHPGVGSVASL